MINIRNLSYVIALLLEDGTPLDISAAVTDLGWEEGERELACRISATIQNQRYRGQPLQELAKPGCPLVILAGEEKPREVARGIITEWEPTRSGKRNSFTIKAYDELFYLQKSQENCYFAAGTGTKTAVTTLLGEWGVPYEYRGPDVPHAKTLFKDDYLSDILLELLESAENQGGAPHMIRAEAGVIKILPEGSNDEVYRFHEDTNLEVVKDKVSTSNLVTRVKILGTEDAEGRQLVMDTLNGKTEYGIRQRIYHYEDVDTLATATTTAQKILDEQGDLERELSLEGPDVPFLRKGDKVYLSTQSAAGYYLVRSIKHDAASCSLSMKVEQLEEAAAEGAVANEEPVTFAKGDAVVLNGTVHRDSYGTGAGNTYTERACTITQVVDLARPCPYHVDGIGWVYPQTIRKS